MIEKGWDKTNLGRWSLLHGQNLAEAQQCKLAALHEKVRAAHATYSAVPYVVLHSAQNIYLTPLDQRFCQDVDSLKCFLESYNLAVEEQSRWKARQVAAAQEFFIPRSLRTIIDRSSLKNSDSASDISNLSCSVADSFSDASDSSFCGSFLPSSPSSGVSLLAGSSSLIAASGDLLNSSVYSLLEGDLVEAPSGGSSHTDESELSHSSVYSLVLESDFYIHRIGSK